jgi:hypothetical protein
MLLVALFIRSVLLRARAQQMGEQPGRVSLSIR